MPMKELPSPLNEFVAAVNAGNADTALSLFSTDGEVNDWGRHFAGPKAIRAWSNKEFIGAGGRMTVADVSQAGDQVTVDASWKTNHYCGDSRFVFTLAGGRIKQMRIAGE